MASTADGIVAVGSRPVDGAVVRAAWFSEDGFTWEPSGVPDAPGGLTAVGADDDALLAVGTSTSTGGPADAVWGSNDGGRTWKVVAEGADLFGEPAPSGRPFVTGMLRVDGRWLAVGGAADGTGETWVSEDGRSWTPPSPRTTPAARRWFRRSDGSLPRLLGRYRLGVRRRHHLVEHTTATPEGITLRAVAGATKIGLGYDSGAPYTTPTPLLRSTDGGLTWSTDPSFLAAAADATAYVVDTVGVIVVGGSEEGSARPAAWVSAGDGRWTGMPPGLSDGQLGGGIRLLARVGSKVVCWPAAPSQCRRARRPRPRRPGSSCSTPRWSRGRNQLLRSTGPSPVGESARDLAERVVKDVFGEEMVTSKVEEAGIERMVTLDTASGAQSVAGVVELPDGTFSLIAHDRRPRRRSPRRRWSRRPGRCPGPAPSRSPVSTASSARPS